MTNCPPLRAGTPKLSAAGPDRKVTIPSLNVSCAVAEAVVSASKAPAARAARRPAVTIVLFIRSFLPSGHAPAMSRRAR
jgi:hypothetical protein